MAIVVGPFTGGDDDKHENGAARTSTTEPHEKATTTTEHGPRKSEPDSECIDAPLVAEAIATELTPVGGGTISKAAALPVANPGFFKYVVAGEIDGDGMEGDGEVGVWAVSQLDGGGTIIAVNGLASEFSTWGADIREDGPVAMRRDEVRDSKPAEDVVDCL